MPLPTIPSGNVASALGGAYEVANSCRFDDGSSAYMHKTPSGAGSLRKITFSCWYKKSQPVNGTTWQQILNCSDSDGNPYFALGLKADKFTVTSGTSSNELQKQSTQVLRDSSAWYHLCVSIDTTDSTADDRVKMYINGTRVTSFAASTNPSLNYDFPSLNTTSYAINIGRDDYGGGEGYLDGYLAEVVFIDGTAYAASDFGEFDEDTPTVFKPKDVSGLTFGTNGFYLDFEDSSNLGNDANGGTDLTEVNLAATDQATDTPTNNFATLNPLASLPNTSKSTFSEGNCIAVAGSNASYVNGGSTIGVANGKWYVETKLTASSDGSARCIIGITMDVSEISRINQDAGSNNIMYSLHYGNFSVAGSTSGFTGLTTSAVGDIVGVALDMENAKVYFSKNGSWLNSGDPTSGSSGTGAAPVAASTTGFRFFFSGSDSNARTMTTAYNFGGCPGFAISSGNADANGYGNFEYAPPTGYYALCSKNLAEFG